MMKLDCAALLLDVDGTLIDSTPAAERSWRRWAREYDADPAAVLLVVHGRRSEDTVRKFVPPGDVEAALRRQDQLEITDLDGVVAAPGAAGLLAALGRRDTVPWALVTSGSLPLVTARMAAAGLPLADVVITAESVRNGKPDPEGYLRAAELLGATAHECVIVEDAPAGIAAGRNATATVVAVSTTFPADALRDAQVVVASLDQLHPSNRSVSITPATLETQPSRGPGS
jgi:sugar-phosphatase